MTDDETPAGPVSLSPRLSKLLASATQEQRERAIEIAAKLLGRRAFREAAGQTDLTQPFNPAARPKADELVTTALVTSTVTSRADELVSKELVSAQVSSIRQATEQASSLRVGR